MNEELTGEISIEYGGEYSSDRYTYSVEITKTPEVEEVCKQLNILESQVENLKRKLLDLVKSQSTLPPTFYIKSVSPRTHKIGIEAIVDGLRLQRKEYPKPEKPKIDVYETIKAHPNFIQILNSGVLTKEEKRKVLGLPAIGEQQQ